MRPVEAASPVGEPEAVFGDRSRRRRRRVLLICAVVVVALLAFGVWWIRSAGPPPLTAADVDQAVWWAAELSVRAQLAYLHLHG